MAFSRANFLSFTFLYHTFVHSSWTSAHPVVAEATDNLSNICLVYRYGPLESSATCRNNRQGRTVSGAEAKTDTSEGCVPAPQQDVHPALHDSAPVWWRCRLLQVRHSHVHGPQSGTGGTLFLREFQNTHWNLLFVRTRMCVLWVHWQFIISRVLVLCHSSSLLVVCL